jgi:vacuolar iron transporter family protein
MAKDNKFKSIQTEVDAAFLYEILAKNEESEALSKIFYEMSDIEKGHAAAFMQHKNIDISQLPKPSARAKVLEMIGKIFGYDYILGVLLDTEKSLASGVRSAKQKNNVVAALSDNAHVAILKNIMDSNSQVYGADLARFEKRHRTVGGNALRAAVLGGNDGLVSNFSLVMGIAGAASGRQEVLLAGCAGLLAGALSMALGEWISVKSSQELYENQMELEMEELIVNPAGEEREIALIYMSKGLDEVQAKAMAKDIMADHSKAHQFLIKEELGINADDLKSSAMEAAIASFVFFAIGAIIPVIPFFFLVGYKAILVSAGMSALGLFGIGAAITLFTGKTVWYSGARQMVFGLAAAAITFGIGKLVGVEILG